VLDDTLALERPQLISELSAAAAANNELKGALAKMSGELDETKQRLVEAQETKKTLEEAFREAQENEEALQGALKEAQGQNKVSPPADYAFRNFNKNLTMPSGK
jgi:predicted nuclease with TOPRIM domain